MGSMQQDVIKELERFLRNQNHRKRLLLALWRVFGQNFVKAWLFRSSLSMLPLLLRLLKSRNLALFWSICQTFFDGSSVKFGLFIASYFALFKGLEEKLIPLIRKRLTIKDNKWDSGIAAAISSITMLLCEGDGAVCKILGHYSAVRGFQIIYNQSQLYKVFGDWLYSFLFMLTSGQIVYTFAKRPEALDPSYEAFMGRAVQINPTIIQTIRNNLWGRHIDYEEIAKVILKDRPECMSLALQRSPTHIGCSWIHPKSKCTEELIKLWPHVFKMMIPVYGTLHAIPPVIFRLGKIFKSPLAYIKAVILGTLRSSSFLATFVFIFRMSLCGHRNAIAYGLLGKSDNFYLYGLHGFLAGASVFIEKSSRQIELSLYVLPRAVSAMIGAIEEYLDIRLVPPHSNLILFSGAMFIIMSCYRKSPEQTPFLVSQILRQLVIPSKSS